MDVASSNNYMQTKTYTIYTFDELDEKAKEKAREWFREGNEYFFLTESLTEQAHDLLKKAKVTTSDIKLYYSLSYSQGDGVMFEMLGTWKSYNVKVRQSGNYYHYNSKAINLESTKTGKDATSQVYSDFNTLYVDICRKLERLGYDYIVYENSNESVDENIIANDYTFLADGTQHD